MFVFADILVTEQDSVTWVTENDGPEEQAKLKWQESFPYREKCKDIATYFALYKCLWTTFAHILVKFEVSLRTKLVYCKVHFFIYQFLIRLFFNIF